MTNSPQKSIEIKTSVLVENNHGEIKIISGELTPNDVRIVDAAKRISQEKLSQKKLIKMDHIGDAYIKLTDQTGGMLSNALHHIFRVYTQYSLNDIDNDLPDSVVQEIVFVKNNSNGHFFFERSYIL
jgi:hypothetical protein